MLWLQLTRQSACANRQRIRGLETNRDYSPVQSNMALHREHQIAEASHRLRLAGVDDPLREARALFAIATGCSDAERYTGLVRPITPAENFRFAQLLQRRLAREPLAYIRETTEFYGMKLLVDDRVLIPRPETELLVEVTAAAVSDVARPVVADVCTGSGCVALALCTLLPNATVIASDISETALKVAASNFSSSSAGAKVCLIQSDLLCALRAASVDAVAANPPYICTHELGGLQPEVGLFEPRIALDGGFDGMRVVQRLVNQAAAVLRSGGALQLEVGAGQAQHVCEMLLINRFIRVTTYRDLAGIERVVQGFLRTQSSA